MIIQTSSLPPSQAIQPDMRAHGVAPAKAIEPAPAPASSPASTPDAAPQPASAEALSDAVATINQAMQQSNRAVEFSIDSDTRRTVVRMVDTGTGELIRQFPSEAALAISRNIAELQQGLLLAEKA